MASDTPLTDKKVGLHYFPGKHGCVRADFARDLERLARQMAKALSYDRSGGMDKMDKDALAAWRAFEKEHQ